VEGVEKGKFGGKMVLYKGKDMVRGELIWWVNAAICE
jgi:hypothetical protein